MLAADELSPSPPTYASKCMKTTILSFFWQNDFNMSVTQVYLGMINYAQCVMVGSSDSDIPVTLKLDQEHQTWYELVDPKQGYNNA